MKQKHILYGVIAGLGVLLYFKFGTKKAKGQQTASGNDNSGSASAPVGEPVKGTTPVKGGECGKFVVYYGMERHKFDWNNGKPMKTVERLLQYPSMGYPKPLFVKASGDGYANLTIAQDYFKPIKSNISVADYNKACADKKSGKFDKDPRSGGGAPPNDVIIVPPNTGGYKPIKGGGVTNTIQPIKGISTGVWNPETNPDRMGMEFAKMSGAGNIDNTDLLDSVKN